jgi:hypothetical protein
MLKLEKPERAEVLAERDRLNVEDLAEKRRIQDVQAKFNRMLADCDLLILPRKTLADVTQRFGNIPNRAHALDPAQLGAVKDFIKAGKPVLFCLGPSGEPARPGMPPGLERDQLEDALADLGFRLPDQTILFNVESKAFAEQVGGLVFLGQEVDVPAVKFAAPQAGRGGDAKTPDLPALRESLRLNTLGVAADDKLALRLKHPRPVYFGGGVDGKGTRAGTFMITSPDAWNTEDPHPTEKGPPQYQPPKVGDPDRGTIKERRQDRFPVAVAAETTVPAAWYEGTGARPEKVRLAVIGHGGVFLGNALNPSQETVLLDTCNWLLGRDDRLARRVDDDGNPIPDWQYPRVHLTDEQNALWQYGARLGMPLLFVYLGCVMWMVRRMR